MAVFARQRFILTKEHVWLLRHANVRWEDCEYGAPAIDCKRPYGNSDVEGDIYKLLNGERMPEHWESVPKETSDYFYKLHKETETALQVVLATGSFEPGEFEAEAYSSRWVRVGTSTPGSEAQ